MLETAVEEVGLTFSYVFNAFKTPLLITSLNLDVFRPLFGCYFVARARSGESDRLLPAGLNRAANLVQKYGLP